jgi:type I restriction enzyme, S subunit
MSDRTVSFSELAGESLIEVGAGRPRSVLDQYPSIPILRVADVLDGRIESPSEDSAPGGYRKVIGSKISKPGDVVLTAKGTVGRVALMPPDGPFFAYSPQLCYFRPTASGPLRSRYLYYWFKSAQFWNQADAFKGQTDMADYLSLSDIQTLKIRIPSLDRQDGIIEVLGSLDDKIAVNDEIARTCDHLRAAELYYWIGSNSGMVKECPLSSVAEFVNGRAFTKDATGTGRMVIRIAEINSGPGPSTVYNDIEVPPAHLARPGDVLFAWSGSLVVTRWFRPEGIINQHIFKVMPDAGIPVWLIFELVNSKLAVFKGVAADKATTMGHIQRRHLDELVHVPIREAIPEIDDKLRPMWDRALAAEQESLKLAELRDTLLPRLMSGEIHVGDAEKVVEEVT